MAAHLRIAAALMAATILSADVAAQATDALVKVVIVSRHGVRTPTLEREELATWSKDLWPVWKEGRGDLTAQGQLLATRLGEWHRLYLTAQKALPWQKCPPAGSVYVYADVVERTQLTARGLIDGLAPGCGVAIESKLPAKVDGVFHPIDARVCRIDARQAERAILERAGGSLSRITTTHKDAFATLQQTLGCCQPKLCAAHGLPGGCTLPQLPTTLAAQPDGLGVGLKGALSIASSASEIFLLEYANAMPASDVGWGRATLPKIREMLALHDVAFDLTERTPYVAKRAGSSLLARAAGAVTGRTYAGVAPPPPVREAKFVAYVGHDTNIANLGGMLGMTWTMPGYPANETPPAGALMFEVREAGGKQRLYASYLAQSPDQMRNVTPLSLQAPPIKLPIRIPACSTDAAGYPCALDDFAQAAAAVLEPECVAR